jgi:hypothetical protein
MEHDGRIYVYCDGYRLLLLIKLEFFVLLSLCKRSLVQFDAVDMKHF